MERTAAGRRTRLAMFRLHHSGPDPVRILLIGDRSVLGDPSRAGEPTRAERLADRLWLTTRRGVDLDLLTDLTPVLHAVRGAFDDWRLWRYDAVIVALDCPVDGLVHIRLRHNLRGLVREVRSDAAVNTCLLVAAPERGTGHPPALSRPADDPVVVCPVDLRQATRDWVDTIAAALAGPLQAAADGPAGSGHDRPEDETLRQRALDELGVVGRPADPNLTELVELARTALGTESAEITVIDHDQQWTMAAAGTTPATGPRSDSFCTSSIEHDGPTIVEDARLDPVLARDPLVLGSRKVRFYAAYPLESPQGYRIGTLCVYDSHPRSADTVSLELLRDLALLAQAELTGLDAPPAGHHMAAG